MNAPAFILHSSRSNLEFTEHMNIYLQDNGTNEYLSAGQQNKIVTFSVESSLILRETKTVFPKEGHKCISVFRTMGQLNICLQDSVTNEYLSAGQRV